MANRKQQLAREIEASRTYTDDSKQKPGRRERVATFKGLYASWGGLDAIFYFRWSELEMGFRTAGIEKQATHVGGRPTPFWDALDALRDRARSDPGIAKLLAILEAQAGGAAAMPTHGRQVKSVTQPDKMTDENLEAARRYRRVHAGMMALKTAEPKHYAVLHIVCMPMRQDPEVEQKWGYELADLCTRTTRIRNSYVMAKGRSGGERVPSFETWLLERIKKGDKLIGMAREDAEKMADEAIAALEGIMDPPKEVKEKQQEAAERAAEPKKRAPRAPRKVNLGYDVEPGEEVAF